MYTLFNILFVYKNSIKTFNRYFTIYVLFFKKYVFFYSDGDSNDQATAESYWTPGHAQNTAEDGPSPYVQSEDFFPSAHGLVQTHPATFSGFGSK